MKGHGGQFIFPLPFDKNVSYARAVEATGESYGE
jgi:hypothetical protein